uniref:Uncharacterized protein n=1 Tax=Romanomermis culicivorax TaxID=13658 RepID=A0A915KA85_ROMCU
MTKDSAFFAQKWPKTTLKCLVKNKILICPAKPPDSATERQPNRLAPTESAWRAMPPPHNNL